MKKLKVPHTYVLIAMLILLLSAALTWFVPGGA